MNAYGGNIQMPKWSKGQQVVPIGSLEYSQFIINIIERKDVFNCKEICLDWWEFLESHTKWNHILNCGKIINISDIKTENDILVIAKKYGRISTDKCFITLFGKHKSDLIENKTKESISLVKRKRGRPRKTPNKLENQMIQTMATMNTFLRSLFPADGKKPKKRVGKVFNVKYCPRKNPKVFSSNNKRTHKDSYKDVKEDLLKSIKNWKEQFQETKEEFKKKLGFISKIVNMESD